MATFFVTNTNDSGEGSLRAAIATANANPGEDTILFFGNRFNDGIPDTITLISGPLVLTDSARTTISGPGADRLAISGNNASRVFGVESGATATFANIAIVNGQGGFGAGIFNAGNLTLRNSQISNNVGERVGGIFNSEGTLLLEGTTINSNQSTLGVGGILNVQGTVEFLNSTISGNSGSSAGGFQTINSQSVTIRSSTFTLNQSGGVNNTQAGPVVIQNTIIAGNNGFDVSGTLDSSSAFNLIGGNPGLAPLANNGGTTQTHALLPDSPARNAGSNALLPSGTLADQRGVSFPRIISNQVDIGAFEALPVVSLVPVSTEQEEGTGTTTRLIYNIFLSAPTNVPVVVALGITGGTATASDFAVVPTTFTINPGSLGGAIFIEVNGDSAFEPDESFTYSMLGVTNATISLNARSVTGVILNDDFPPVNRDPVAANDSATVAAYQSVNVNVLANDSDPDGDPLTLSVANNPSNGTAIANNNNTPNNISDDFITYTPTPGYAGSDRFTYQIADGRGGTAIATVNIMVTGANLVGTPGKDTLIGTDAVDTIDGKAGNDQITGKKADDLLTGGGRQDRFIYNLGDGRDTITDFGGFGQGSNPSAATRAEIDIIQFRGAGFTARNMMLRTIGANLEISFAGIADTTLILQNFKLENLENEPRRNNSTPALGNIQFTGQTSIQDSFDVFDADSTRRTLFNRNTVTFLNHLNNTVAGFNNSNDVINGQDGNDNLHGRSGNDLLRGEAGNDILNGGAGNDTLVGGTGGDRFLFASGRSYRASDFGVDAIADFTSTEGDRIVLSRQSFRALTTSAANSLRLSDFDVINAPTNIAVARLSARIVYNQMTGDLIYNENGAAPGLGNGGRFAILTTRPGLNTTDFSIQA